MNELLQKHGCANVFSMPEGLKELMSDISREVLRAQPPDVNDFIANYLSVLLITREHGVMAVKILDDLCDCRPSILEHLQQLGMENDQARLLADIIQEEIEGTEENEGKETIREYQIVKKVLARRQLDEVMTAKVCQVARNAYRDYWYRKKTLQKGLKMKPDVPWEIAAEHTLELYKKTKPSFSELSRATEKIQAAYKGYYVRRNILRHLKPKTRKKGPKVDLPGPPIDLGGSREIDLGPMIDITNVKSLRPNNVTVMFSQCITNALGLSYDPTKTITHVPDEEELLKEPIIHSSQDKGERTPQTLSDRASHMSTVLSQPPATPTSRVESRSSRDSVAPGRHHSRVSSQAADSHLSHRSSEGTAAPANLKISFSNIPPEVIQSISQPASEADAAEVPEDIMEDDHSDVDIPSAPTASMPSSAVSTANSTDVEDEIALNTSGDEK